MRHKQEDLLPLVASCCSLPQHVVSQLLGLRAHGRQFRKLLLEDVVRMGAFVHVELRRIECVKKSVAGNIAQT